MSDRNESPLLTPEEAPAVRVLNASGAADVVLVCEHASRFVPAALAGLGLDQEASASHAAWDIGAEALALEMAEALDATLVASRVSRLVYDCNRPPEAEDAIPVQSERFAIPGNRDLSPAERARRVDEVYYPFRAALADVLAKRTRPAMLVTVHSFTPVYHGAPREVQLGLLHDADDRVANAMLRVAGKHTQMKTALNQPYDASHGVTHTLRVHAIPAGLPNVMLEVRNDLLGAAEGVRKVASELGAMLADVIAEFDGLRLGGRWQAASPVSGTDHV